MNIKWRRKKVINFYSEVLCLRLRYSRDRKGLRALRIDNPSNGLNSLFMWWTTILEAQSAFWIPFNAELPNIYTQIFWESDGLCWFPFRIYSSSSNMKLKGVSVFFLVVNTYIMWFVVRDYESNRMHQRSRITYWNTWSMNYKLYYWLNWIHDT